MSKVAIINQVLEYLSYKGAHFQKIQNHSFVIGGSIICGILGVCILFASAK
jgi:hypothetical protein